MKDLGVFKYLNDTRNDPSICEASVAVIYATRNISSYYSDF